MLACAEPPKGEASATLPTDIDAVVSPDVVTVITVRWHTEVATAGYVEFGESGELGRSTPVTEAGTEHEVLLLGLPADTEIHFRPVTVAGDESALIATIATGSLPAGIYPMEVTGETPGWHGYQVFTLQGSAFAVIIIDSLGRTVWYRTVEVTGHLMRAFLSNDGESLVYLVSGSGEHPENDAIVRVALDGSTVTEIPIPSASLDMVELPDGSFAVIVAEDRGEEGAASLGDTIVEVAADGATRVIWSAWDQYDPIPDTADIHDWTHANALDYDAASDAYYLSMKSLRCLVKIDRTTGELLWTMNGPLSDFAGAAIDVHHQFHLLDRGVLFFENGPDERGSSRAVEVSYDEDAGTMEEVWSYVHDPPLLVYATGDVHRFDDGTTGIAWSTAGEIQRVTPDGEVIWQLNVDLGQALTYVQVVESMYVGG